MLNKLRVYIPAYYAAFKDRILKKSDKRDVAFHYHGYFVHWTGWKLSQSNHLVVGQWWAVVAGTRPWSGYYASLPGGEGSFRVGANFDIQDRKDQKILTIEELSQRKLSSYVRRQECWMRLKKQLDGNPIRESQVLRKQKFMREIRKAS